MSVEDRFEIEPVGKLAPTPTSWWAGTTADPSISRGIDGRLTLNWDDHAPDHCVVHRVALVDLIAEMGGLNDEIDRLKAELIRFGQGFKRHTKAEYRLVSADGGIAISYPTHEHDALLRAKQFHEMSPTYEIELVRSESWSTDWTTVERVAVDPT